MRWTPEITRTMRNLWDRGSSTAEIARQLGGDVTPSKVVKKVSELRFPRRKCRHGFSDTPTYTAWLGMIDRCERPANKAWPDYGGRGIKVCARWRNGFPAFLEDMGKKPSKQYSIDRKDNDGNYEPGNCRWATSKEQNNNKRSNRLICARGETKTLTEWARISGRTAGTIWARLARGLSAEVAIFGAYYGRNLTIDGRTMSLTEWSRESGINWTTINSRLKNGMEPREAVFKPSAGAFDTTKAIDELESA